MEGIQGLMQGAGQGDGHRDQGWNKDKDVPISSSLQPGLTPLPRPNPGHPINGELQG